MLPSILLAFFTKKIYQEKVFVSPSGMFEKSYQCVSHNNVNFFLPQVGSCSSLLQGHKSLDGSSCSTTTGDESEIISTPILETVANNHFTKTNAPVIEDESGFSSMSSFQENNSAEYRNGFCHDLRSRLPEIHAYPEIGKRMRD